MGANRMKLGQVLVAVALCLLSPAALHADSAGIEGRELERQIADGSAPYVIDVRTPAEYAGGHVPGAVLYPIHAFPGIISSIPVAKEQPLVVYCERGPRAILAKVALTLAGYTNVRYLRGHMSNWRASGLAIEK